MSRLLIHCPSECLISVRRKFFTSNHFAPIEFRRGVFQAVHCGGTEALTINVDITTGIFWHSDNVTLADLAMNFPLEGNELCRRCICRQRILPGCKALAWHEVHGPPSLSSRGWYGLWRAGGAYCHQITSQFGIGKTIQDNDGKPIILRYYMKKVHNLTLKYPRVFQVQRGSNTCLPLEIVLAPQLPFSVHDVHCKRYPSRLDEVQVRAMIDFASRVHPSLQLPCSANSVALATKTNHLKYDLDERLKAAKIEVNREMAWIFGRRLTFATNLSSYCQFSLPPSPSVGHPHDCLQASLIVPLYLVNFRRRDSKMGSCGTGVPQP